MGIFEEWFIWGQSDLFWIGVIIILIAACLPWNVEKNRFNYIMIMVCIGIYAFSEFVVTFRRWNWGALYIYLFVGGIALAIGIGRVIKMVFRKFIIKD